eukprot:gene1104-1258_t
MSTPPMFGDYEAQRHWMELTTKLPITQWYFNTTDNNLQYWGLDYPPLTAYLSWAFGKVLGLALIAITFILKDCQLLASFFFVLSLNYKQISKSIGKILIIGVVVILSFAICWLPFLSLEQVSQLLFRLFPVARGLYEDKVANFWCVTSTLINYKLLFTPDVLLKLCTLATLTGFLPIVYCLSRNCSKVMFLYSLIISSFSFYLFSFQVHEKTILLVLMPISLLALRHSFGVWWFGVVATFSMSPLLFFDRLQVPYFAILFVYLSLGYQVVIATRVTSSDKPSKICWKRALFLSVNLALMAVCNYLVLFTSPPAKLPALFQLFVASLSFVHFGLYVLYFLNQMRLEIKNQPSSSSTKKAKIH